jgi:hypothetical protein
LCLFWLQIKNFTFTGHFCVNWHDLCCVFTKAPQRGPTNATPWQETNMNSQSQAIEEGIKIALDAADTATSVVGEFGQIKADYAEARKQMARTYKLIATIVISSVSAMALAMLAAGVLYFKALSEMQNASNGALEGMMLLTEAVDKLEGSAGKAESQAKNIAALIEVTTETSATLSTLEKTTEAQQDAVTAQLTASDNQMQGLFSQQIGSLMESIDTGLSTQAQAISDLADKAAAVSLPTSLPMGGTSKPSDTAIAALSVQLDTILLLQKEISAKITVAPRAPVVKKVPKKKAAPKVKSAPKKAPDDIIKFP